MFQTLEKVMDRLCESVNKVIDETIKSISCRNWIGSIASSGFLIKLCIELSHDKVCCLKLFLYKIDMFEQ